jgi:hypothetical protein
VPLSTPVGPDWACALNFESAGRPDSPHDRPLSVVRKIRFDPDKYLKGADLLHPTYVGRKIFDMCNIAHKSLDRPG